MAHGHGHSHGIGSGSGTAMALASQTWTYTWHTDTVCLRIIKKTFKWYICNFEIFLTYKNKIGPGMDTAAALGHSHGIGISISLSNMYLDCILNFI